MNRVHYIKADKCKGVRLCPAVQFKRMNAYSILQIDNITIQVKKTVPIVILRIQGLGVNKITKGLGVRRSSFEHIPKHTCPGICLG